VPGTIQNRETSHLEAQGQQIKRNKDHLQVTLRGTHHPDLQIWRRVCGWLTILELPP